MRINHRQEFIDSFKKRFLLRLHMTGMLLATLGSGIVCGKLLYAAGVRDMRARYVLAVVASYLVLVLVMRLWLMILLRGARRRAATTARTRNQFLDLDAGDLLDVMLEPADASGTLGGPGGLSGGGSSGGYRPAGIRSASPGEAGGSGGVGSGGKGGVRFVKDAGDRGKSGGKSGSADFGLDEAMLVVLLVALVAAILFAGIYLVWEAPMILAETAFEVALAAGMMRQLRTIAQPDWVGSVAKFTWKP